MEVEKESLGDYLKALEGVEASRHGVLGQPIMARLDGRAFHTFTQGLGRPYDIRLTNLMIDTASYLVRHTQAMLAYTQSDEISLTWYEPENSLNSYFFGGRYQKIATILSSMASAYFNKHLASSIPEKAQAMPIFDARVWSVPTLRDAYLNYLWREQDAIKNSITMAALSKFPHKQLQNVNGLEKRKMLAEVGAPWEDMPEFFRKGTYVKRVEMSRMLTQAELERIPEKHRPTGPVLRSDVMPVSMPVLGEADDPQALLFGCTS